MDYTYIENRISFGILQEAGLMPLFFKFVELKINDNTQGVYLLIEDPEQYFMELGSEYILRRGYNHYISDSEYIPQFYHKPEIDYKTRYLEIYDQLTTLNGLMLYDETASRINIEQYFHKMAIDYLLKNGDYTDEIFLYAQIEQDLIRYHIIPWDYDDIFKNKPHEVGLTWGTGKIYGDRYYETIEDIYDEIGDKLIFSIEDDLDYTIAMDSILYMKYTESFGQLLETVDEQLIERVFMETENELISFYNSYTVVEQSKYDRDKTDKELWMSNMEEKKTFLLDRLNETKSRLITENE
jgi:spore coat protein H